MVNQLLGPRYPQRYLATVIGRQMIRRGYLGMLQHVYLAGYSAGDLAAAAESGTNVIMPIDRMFYVSAFQSGVDHFIVPAIHEGAKDLEFLQKRTTHAKSDSDFKLFSEIDNVFQSFKLAPKSKDLPNVTVPGFVSSLIGAMQHNAALLNVMPLPNPEEITQFFAPELASPLMQLIAELRPIAESVPVPLTAIDRSNVERFQDLLCTADFSKYSQSHADLEDAECDATKALSNIRRTGHALIRRGEHLLTPRPSLMHILNIIPKVIDTVFGKLPGALAQLAGNVAQERLDGRKQVVIYQFDQWMSDFSRMRRGSHENAS